MPEDDDYHVGHVAGGPRDDPARDFTSVVDDWPDVDVTRRNVAKQNVFKRHERRNVKNNDVDSVAHDGAEILAEAKPQVLQLEGPAIRDVMARRRRSEARVDPSPLLRVLDLQLSAADRNHSLPRLRRRLTKVHFAKILLTAKLKLP